MAWAYGQGYQCAMVTFTTPHNRGNSLADFQELFKKAFKRFRGGKVFDKFKKRIGFQGLVRSMEVTHGKNGWHLHTHELWILDKEQNEGQVVDAVKNRWLDSIEKAGISELADYDREAAYAHAVDIKFNCDTSDYLAKYDDEKYLRGVDWEIASANTKKGNKSGLHPFQILGKFQETRQKKFARLYIEYLDATKGKAQLFFSRGLKKRAGLLDEITDEQLSETTPVEGDEKIYSLDTFDWTIIAKSRVDYRAIILGIAENEGRSGVAKWLTENGSGPKYIVETWEDNTKFIEFNH